MKVVENKAGDKVLALEDGKRYPDAMSLDSRTELPFPDSPRENRTAEGFHPSTRLYLKVDGYTFPLTGDELAHIVETEEVVLTVLRAKSYQHHTGDKKQNDGFIVFEVL